MQGKLTVAELVAGIGAIVVLLFSFFDVVGDSNAWSRQGAYIVLVIPPLLAIGMIVLIVLRLVGTNMTSRVVTFTVDQLKAVMAVVPSLIMIFLLLSDTQLGGFGFDWEVGFWFMLLGSLAMGAGTIMALLGVGDQTIGASGGGSSGAPQYPQQQYPNQPYQAPPPQAPGAPPPPPSGSTPPPPPPGGSGTPPPPPPNG